jgi:hypothetical protein
MAKDYRKINGVWYKLIKTGLNESGVERERNAYAGVTVKFIERKKGCSYYFDMYIKEKPISIR